MIPLDPHQTVGRLAVERPRSVRVFQRHGIDFCCGGSLSLAEACARRNLDPVRVLEEIRDEERRPDAAGVRYDEWPLPELIDHILVHYHRPLESELPRLTALARKVRDVHGPKEPRLFESLVETLQALRDDLETHMHKEEQVLFPWIRSGNGSTAGAPIRVMMHEHEMAADLLAELRRLTGDYQVPAEACASWRALWEGLRELEVDLHEHMHLENNVLFPRALAG